MYILKEQLASNYFLLFIFYDVLLMLYWLTWKWIFRQTHDIIMCPATAKLGLLLLWVKLLELLELYIVYVQYYWMFASKSPLWILFILNDYLLQRHYGVNLIDLKQDKPQLAFIGAFTEQRGIGWSNQPLCPLTYMFFFPSKIITLIRENKLPFVYV